MITVIHRHGTIEAHAGAAPLLFILRIQVVDRTGLVSAPHFPSPISQKLLPNSVLTKEAFLLSPKSMRRLSYALTSSTTAIITLHQQP